MAENHHLENRTMQLVRRVESLLNNLPEQGEPLEARKLKHITSFNESLAKELETIKAECQEKLRSTGEKETAAARALNDAVEKSRVLSEETEQLRIEAAALQKNQTENVELSKKLEDMISSASSERRSLEKERKTMGSTATKLTKREEALQAGLAQLEEDRLAHVRDSESDRQARLNELEQKRLALDRADQDTRSQLEQMRLSHEEKFSEDNLRLQKLSEELEQGRLTHAVAVREHQAQAQTRSRELDEKEEELDRQAQGISAQRETLDKERTILLKRSADVTKKQSGLDTKEKMLGQQEERLQALQKKVTDSEKQCKEFVTAHNSQVDLFEKTCADYMDKQKQIDNEKAKVSTKDGIITAMKAQLSEERQAVKDLRARLSRAETELTARNARVETLRHAGAEKGKELGEILELLRAMDMSGSTMDSTIDVIQESTESVKKLEGELSSKLEASDAVEKNLEAAYNDIDRLNKDVASRDETITRLKEQKETMEQSAREADTELGKLRAQIQDKTSELSTRDARLDSLRRELEGEAEKVKDLAHTRVK